MIKEWAVTTSKANECLGDRAKAMAEELSILYVERNKKSVEYLMEKYKIDGLFVLQGEKVSLHCDGATIFFHPGMALPRIKAVRKGQVDVMSKAMGLEEGMTVLDCTLGLANDAIVMSHQVGASGRVHGLESSRGAYGITKWGLKQWGIDDKEIKAAFERITAQEGNYHGVLPTIEDASYDVVYFDPMFEKALEDSDGIANLRHIANYQALIMEDIEEALRVAKKRVVVKHRKNELNYLPFNEIISGNDSPIGFGVFYK